MQVWICTVCGYVHRGDGPPDFCPVCGAPPEMFEPYREPAKTEPTASVRVWRCLICGYSASGISAPDFCPVCSAPSAEFEAAAEPDVVATGAGGRLRVAVVGAGIAGLSAAESARTASPDAEITLYSREQSLPYYRLNLTRYVAGEIGKESLRIHPESWYAGQRIRLERGVDIEAIDTDCRVVKAGGTAEPYDRIILASGGHAFVPPIPGADLDTVRVLRSVDDADGLIDEARPGVRCICIGGGILGLETAAGLARRGAEVVVLESYDWLLPRQLNRRAAEVLGEYVATKDIAVVPGVKITGVTADGAGRRVSTGDGRVFAGDLVVVTAGIRSNTHLARRAGLAVNNGVLVDTRLATSHPGIYAAGDVAEFQGTVFGIWEPARYQGSIAGMNAVGSDTEFGGIPRANALKVLGVDLFSVGQFEPLDGSYVAVDGETDGRYYRFLFRDNRLVGAVFVGDAHPAAAATKAVKTGADFSRVLGKTPTAEAVIAAL